LGKYGLAKQDTDDSIIQHMHIACCNLKAADTYSEYIILTVLPVQSYYTKAPHCYVTRKLPVIVM